MTQKDIVATALEQVEKEKQEAEIVKIKGIVKAYLEKILNKKEAIKVLQKDLKELEADLDDLKLGRLDKIEERQEKDPEHNKITLLIIKRVEKEFLPYQPWRSPYIIDWNNALSNGGTCAPLCNTAYTTLPTPLITYTMTGSDLATSMMGELLTATGTMFQNFCGGTYDVNGRIINF